MKPKPALTWIAIGACSLAMGTATEPANANATPGVRITLQKQIDRADQVAHVVILERLSLANVDNGPWQSCGLKYRVQVVEQFKGKPNPAISGFATHRFLLPHKKLQAGDHVLVLLSNVSGIATAADFEGNPSITELAVSSMKPATVACQRARGNLYLNDFAENIFLIEFKPTSTAWLDFSGNTDLPPEIGTPTLAPCDPQPGGRSCVWHEPNRIEWERVRRALPSMARPQDAR